MNSTILPKSEGFIEVRINGEYQYLTVKNETFLKDVARSVGFSPKQLPATGPQTWKLGKPDNMGWMTISNTELGTHSYLTSNYIGNLRSLTVDKKGTLLLTL